jgi:hypothetical protein
MEGFMQESKASPLPLGRGFLFKVKAIEAEVYKLSEKDKRSFDYCINEIEFLLSTFEMTAQLAVAMVGAKLAADEE